MLATNFFLITVQVVLFSLILAGKTSEEIFSVSALILISEFRFLLPLFIKEWKEKSADEEKRDEEKRAEMESALKRQGLR